MQFKMTQQQMVNTANATGVAAAVATVAYVISALWRTNREEDLNRKAVEILDKAYDVTKAKDVTAAPAQA